MRKTRLLILLLASALLLTACIDTSTPTGVIKMLVEHLKKGNLEEAEKIFAEPASFAPVREVMEDPMRGPLLQQLMEVAQIHHASEGTSGNTATVELIITAPDPQALGAIDTLLKEKRAALAEDASAQAVREAMTEALKAVDWKSLSTAENALTYPLVKVDGKWKLDAAAAQFLQEPVP